VISTFFLVRKAFVGKTVLRFFGIAADTSELRSFKEDGVYEKPMMERFKDDAIKSEVFFDIGSNIGNYSVFYGKISSGKCFCWEPVRYFRVLQLMNQLINNFSLSRFTMSKKFVGTEDNENVINLNSFCRKKNIYPDLIKIDVEGAESIILPSLNDEFYERKLTVYLEFHVPQIKQDFGENPFKFLDFIFEKFEHIEFNRNHWGAFKGVPPGNWEIKDKKFIETVINDILEGQSKPRGFGMILTNFAR
jgi:hypothetical protein